MIAGPRPLCGSLVVGAVSGVFDLDRCALGDAVCFLSPGWWSGSDLGEVQIVQLDPNGCATQADLAEMMIGLSFHIAREKLLGCGADRGICVLGWRSLGKHGDVDSVKEWLRDCGGPRRRDEEQEEEQLMVNHGGYLSNWVEHCYQKS